MNRASRSLLILAAALTTGVSCQTDLIDDPGFQFWCGERLCAWTLEEGDIDKVATWHEHDYGVELVGPSVLLWQEAQSGASCVRIEVTSQIDQGVTVTVEVDEDGDGTVEWIVPVPPSRSFVSRAWDIEDDASFRAVYYVRKDGDGRAVIARARASRECGYER